MGLTVREILKKEYKNFSSSHILKNMFQTIEYADLMSKYGYIPMYVGAFDGEKMVACSLILTKGIAPAFKYGYAPRGFLIDYLNSELLSEFTQKLQAFLYKKNIVFVKINPEITYSIVNEETGEKEINYINAKIVDILENLGYVKLKDNLYFEALLPKYNAVINLMEHTDKDVKTATKTKISKNSKRGLKIVEGKEEDIEKFYEFVKNKKDREIEYYKDYYNIYKASNMMDLLFVELNNNEYLMTVKNEYEKELDINNQINLEFQENPKSESIYNKKMNSDKRINDLNIEIGEIALKIRKNIITETVAGALVIKYMNRIYILISGFDKNYSKLSPNYFLYGQMIEMYKQEGFKFLDLNGVTGDFTDDNPYKGLNDFKISFGPKIYEYVGEFDMIVNKTMYQLLLSSNRLQKEFQRKDIKTTEGSNKNKNE